MKLESNTDLVNNLMEYSPYGALCQVFIIQAIRSFAKQVANAPLIDDGGMISPEAWKGVAEDVKARCDAFYNRHFTVVES